MKYFAPLLAVSVLALTSAGLAYHYCSDKAAKTKTDDGIVTLAKTPVSSKGMVVTANPYATQAGVEVLQAGGSALDAAIAVQLSLIHI